MIELIIALPHSSSAMKRSSEEEEKQLSPPKKQSKLSREEVESSTEASKQNINFEGERQMQLAVAASSSGGESPGMAPSSLLASYPGMPNNLIANGLLYGNSSFASQGMTHASAPSPISVPSLLANLPMHPHQRQLGQQSQLPMSFASQFTTSDSLTEYILAAQLSRGFGSGQPLSHHQQLNLLGFANSMQQRINFSQRSFIDQAVFYGLSSQGNPGQRDGPGGLSVPPILPNNSGGDAGTVSTPLANTSPAKDASPFAVQASTSDSLPLSLTTDRSNLSDYQCLIREQIDLFAATQADIDSSAQGRNRPIVVQQVGIRCRHCASLPSSRRSRGAVYYPAKLAGLYQAAQNMTLNHFTTTCQSLPQPVRDEMIRLKQRKSYVLGGGKGYWARGGQIRNIIEVDDRLFFRDKVPETLTGRVEP